jgi:hypothetical protein
VNGKGYEFLHNLSTDNRGHHDVWREKRSIGRTQEGHDTILHSFKGGVDHEYTNAATLAEDLTVNMEAFMGVRMWSRVFCE